MNSKKRKNVYKKESFHNYYTSKRQLAWLNFMVTLSISEKSWDVLVDKKKILVNYKKKKIRTNKNSFKITLSCDSYRDKKSFKSVPIYSDHNLGQFFIRWFIVDKIKCLLTIQTRPIYKNTSDHRYNSQSDYYISMNCSDELTQT